MKPTIIFAGLLLMAPVPGFGKKIKPEEFKVQANIVEVLLLDATQGEPTAHPRLPAFCSNPEAGLQKGYCQAAAAAVDTTTVKRATYYNLVTEIGDKVYNLRGTILLDLGTYPAKFIQHSRDSSPEVVFLSKDKKGKPIAPQYRIVSVRPKAPEKAE